MSADGKTEAPRSTPHRNDTATPAKTATGKKYKSRFTSSSLRYQLRATRSVGLADRSAVKTVFDVRNSGRVVPAGVSNP